MKLARWIVARCPPVERAARKAMGRLGRFLTMEDLRDRGGRLQATITEGRFYLALLRQAQAAARGRLAEADRLPPALSPFDNAAFAVQAARLRLRVRCWRLAERAVAWVVERKTAEARRLGLKVD